MATCFTDAVWTVFQEEETATDEVEALQARLQSL